MLFVHARVGKSAIHGLGLIAQEFIPKGTMVWKFDPKFDMRITEADFNKLPAAAQAMVRYYAEWVEDEKAFWLSVDDERFSNHSDTPNMEQRGDEGFAACDIHPGDEMFCDYRMIDMLDAKPGVHF